MLKLNEAEKDLKLKIPNYLFDFISKLKNEEVSFGGESWLFWTVSETQKKSKGNFIIETSQSLSEEWNFSCLAFATNGIGDYIFLKQADNGEFEDEIYFLMHETAEIRLFAENWNALLENGPLDYYKRDNNFIYRLDGENNVITPSDFSENSIEEQYTEEELANLQFFKDQEFKSKIDDLIDDGRAEDLEEILNGLHTISTFQDDSLKSWAFNKLSDFYLKGFLTIEKNYDLALKYNQKAMDLNSHKAYSNRAAAHFAGIGVERNLNLALEFATKANNISKTNSFLAGQESEENEGLYNNLLQIIKRKIDQEKHN